MSQITIRAKLGAVTAIQLGLAHAILVAADEVFAAKPELKATYTVEFTGREFKQANVARVSAPRQEACSNPHQKDAEPVPPVADEQDEQDEQDLQYED